MGKLFPKTKIVLKKLKEYFRNHPEITSKLAKNKKAKILVTDITKNVEKLTSLWFGKDTKLGLVKL